MIYPVNNIYSCIQGEGCLSGTAMVMLRLQGCGVGCPWCDTKETWETGQDNLCFSFDRALGTNEKYTLKQAKDISRFIKIYYPNFKWVLVSGGEPSQYDLKELVAQLHSQGYKVSLETSGTEVGHIGANFDWVCVSPKIDMPGGKAFRHVTLTLADELKYVIGKRADLVKLDNILAMSQLKEDCQILLQPLSQSEKATELCTHIAMERGYRLSIQLHKYLNLP